MFNNRSTNPFRDMDKIVGTLSGIRKLGHVFSNRIMTQNTR